MRAQAALGILLFVAGAGGLEGQAPSTGTLVDARGNFIRIGPDSLLERLVLGACPEERVVSTADLRLRADSLGAVPRPDSVVLRRITCARAMLAVRRTTASASGPDMPLGTPWAVGALMSADRWVLASQGDTLPATFEAAIAMTLSRLQGVAANSSFRRLRPTDRDPAPMLKQLVRTLDAGNNSSTLLIGCTALALDVDDFALAERCSRRALEVGADSSWHLIRLSYASARTQKPMAEVLKFTDAAILSAHSREDAAQVGWHLDYRAPGFFEDAAHAMTDWRGSEVVFQQKATWLAAEPAERLARFHRRMEELADFFGVAGGNAYLYVHFSSIVHSAGDFRTCHSQETSPRYCMAPHLMNAPAQPVPLLTRLTRLWNPATMQLTGIVSYALGMSATRVIGNQDSSRVILALTPWVRGPLGGRVQRYRISMPRAAAPRDDQFQTGYITFPVSDTGAIAVQLEAQDQRGAAMATATAGVAPLDGVGFALSDLAVGPQVKGMTWAIGDSVQVPLHPFPAVSRSAPEVSIFFQILAKQHADSAKASLRLFRADGEGAQEKPLLAVTWPVAILQGLTNVERLLDLSRLPAGKYLLEVSVRPSHGDANEGIRRRTSIVVH